MMEILPDADELAHEFGDSPAAHEIADRYIVERERLGPGTTGAAFLLDHDPRIVNLWGEGKHILWSGGEPLMIVAPPGTGKSTLAQQLCLRRAGVIDSTLLGYHVEPGEGNCLYIAADRPRQIKRSWRRMVNEEHRAELSNHVVIYEGTPPFRVSSNPEKLLNWVRSFKEIDTVFIDAYLDLGRLAEEEGAALANEALQALVLHDIEVCVVHHDRKMGNDPRKMPRLDDVYGGRSITKGMGSVLYLNGESGALAAEVVHLKPPEWRIQNFDIRIDPATGEVYKDDAW